jgi:hypothetical protein
VSLNNSILNSLNNIQSQINILASVLSHLVTSYTLEYYDVNTLGDMDSSTLGFLDCVINKGE